MRALPVLIEYGGSGFVSASENLKRWWIVGESSLFQEEEEEGEGEEGEGADKLGKFVPATPIQVYNPCFKIDIFHSFTC